MYCSLLAILAISINMVSYTESLNIVKPYNSITYNENSSTQNLQDNVIAAQPATSEMIKNLSTEEIIIDIRSKVNNIIKQVPNYASIEEEVMGESTEGGVIKGFYDGAELKKITAILYGETGKRTYEYYYNQGMLIFAYDETQFYNTPIYYLSPSEEPTISSKEGQRFYFKDGQMVQWITKEGETVRDNKNPDFKDWASFVQEIDQRWREELE